MYIFMFCIDRQALGFRDVLTAFNRSKKPQKKIGANYRLVLKKPNCKARNNIKTTDANLKSKYHQTKKENKK